MANKVYLSPSDQTANKYAYGNTNEAVACRKIADACEVALKRCGFEVKNNKTDSMQARCNESDKWGADLHVPIHTNAFNKQVTGTRIFCYSKASKGYKAAHAIFDVLAPLTPGTSENVTVNASLYETRYPNAPTAYVEVDFHDVEETAKWIIENVEAIGEAICKGICNYFGRAYVEPVPPVVEKYHVELGEYGTIKEADAMLGGVYARVSAVEAALAEAHNALDELETVLRKAVIAER